MVSDRIRAGRGRHSGSPVDSRGPARNRKMHSLQQYSRMRPDSSAVAPQVSLFGIVPIRALPKLPAPWCANPGRLPRTSFGKIFGLRQRDRPALPAPARNFFMVERPLGAGGGWPIPSRVARSRLAACTSCRPRTGPGRRCGAVLEEAIHSAAVGAWCPRGAPHVERMAKILMRAPSHSGCSLPDTYRSPFGVSWQRTRIFSIVIHRENMPRA